MEQSLSEPGYETLIRQAARYRAQGHVAAAIATYRQLLASWPQSPDAWYNLARLQRQARQYGEALSSYGEALRRGARHPEEIHLNRAVILSDDLHRHEEAERELGIALGLNGAYIPALMNLGNLHEDLGRREAAASAYGRILELEPGRLEILARYAYLSKFSDPSDPLIARMRAAVADSRASAAGRAAVGFALGRALDACGEFPAAFESYALANRLSRESAGAGFRPYDRTAQERLVDRIIAAFPARAGMVAEAPESLPRPVFVLGMFRSGSTLLEQLLGAHPRVTPGGELDLLPFLAEQALGPFPEGAACAREAQLAAAAARYRGALESAFPQAGLVTDKRPDNFLYIGLIKRLFPRAKIVHTVRDPLDNCLSVFFLHLDPRMSYALDLEDTAHFYGQYRRLMAHWRALFGSDIHDVSYDALVREPKPVLERLLTFLGLEWDERCLQLSTAARAVKTASVWQVREPLYVSSSGRARHYLAQLRGVRQRLAAVASDPRAAEPEPDRN